MENRQGGCTMSYMDLNKFAVDATKKLHEGLGGRLRVSLLNLTDGADITIPCIVASNEAGHFAEPLTQGYIRYMEVFDGNFNRYCEDLCKAAEEFDAFTSDLEGEIEME